MIITFISDTHTKHRELSLPGGDLLIHAGDLMNTGYQLGEITDFCKWFEAQDYDVCTFIAGNHDRAFETLPERVAEIVNSYGVDYLQDDSIEYSRSSPLVKIWGSPWQPEFYNWAFNLPRSGDALRRQWSRMPVDTEILVTHGPPQGILDTSGPPYNQPLLGCELLLERVESVRPKIHVFGHIHGGYGYRFHNGTHFINASVLDEGYRQVNKPVTVDWDPITNQLEFL